MTLPSLEPLPGVDRPPGPAGGLGSRIGGFCREHGALMALLVVVFVVFGQFSRNFLTTGNVLSVLVQSSSVAIVATGMTLVLLIGGIDLSVGAIMFLSAAVAGQLVLGKLHPELSPISTWLAVVLIVPMGMLFGAVNAALIAYLRMVPFVVTLAMLFIGRGLATQLTGTRALNLPAEFLALGHARVLGVPFPLVVLIGVVVSAHALLTRTPFGRQLYAMGNNVEAARKAGINTRRLTASVYILSGFCAAVGGIVSVAQLGAVSPKFGEQREFSAIAAAVLGGTSLFGGRGSVLPGALLGAVLMQAVESGLVMAKANEYAYPVITAGVIFVAVLMDRLRNK